MKPLTDKQRATLYHKAVLWTIIKKPSDQGIRCKDRCSHYEKCYNNNKNDIHWNNHKDNFATKMRFVYFFAEKLPAGYYGFLYKNE